MQRAFWKLLVDMAEALEPTAAESGIRVESLEIDAPLQVQLREVGGELQFLADVPRWRWTTDFDEKPCRMHMILTEGRSS